MTRQQKLQLLQDKILDKYIEALNNDEIEVKDLGSIIAYLKNNKVVETTVEHSESDLIDDLIEDAK